MLRNEYKKTALVCIACLHLALAEAQTERFYFGISPVIQLTAQENSSSALGLGVTAQGQYWINRQLVALTEIGGIHFARLSNGANTYAAKSYNILPLLGGAEVHLFEKVFLQGLVGYSIARGVYKQSSAGTVDEDNSINGAITYGYALGSRISEKIDLALKGYTVRFSNANRWATVNNNSLGVQLVYFF